MDIEEALRIVDHLLASKGLNNVQEFVFRQSWQNRSYAKMADEGRYDETYLKYVGFKLWKVLSEVMQQKVTKVNLHAAIDRYARSLSLADRSLDLDPTNTPSIPTPSLRDHPPDFNRPSPTPDHPPRDTSPLPSIPPAPTLAVPELSSCLPSPPIATPSVAYTIASLEKALVQPHQDWGEAMDVTQFLGRSEELVQLEQWIRQERCRLVAVVGMGGIGKSTLAIRVGEQVSQSPETDSTSFEFLIWRSLRNAPPLENLLVDLIQFLSHHQETAASLPADVNGRLARLFHYLRQSRCLVILDNLETVLLSGERVGQYRPAYEGYGELLKQAGELRHQSCFLITSREKPKEIALNEGKQSAVRSLLLSGLNLAEGRTIMQQRVAFEGQDTDWQTLVQHYAGNPLALKMVAVAIEDVFDRSVVGFLEYVQQQNNRLIFDDIRDLLAHQFDRLSEAEQEVMYWLAINRELVSLNDLQSDLITVTTKQTLLETLRSLSRRSFIETQAGSYTQQPVVMEFVTEALISQITTELTIEFSAETSELKLDQLNRYALSKTTTKDYIRESQLQFILEPIANHLQDAYSNRALDRQFRGILELLRGNNYPTKGYASGNIINLANALQLDLTGYNFANLSVWHADLRKTKLKAVNFTAADLSKSVFIQTLGYVLSVAISPDGQSMATGDGNGRVQLWQAGDGQPLCLLQQGQTSWVWALAWHPTGTLLAEGSVDQTVRLWNPQTGECLRALCGHQNWVRTVAWSPDGQRLASGSTDRTIKLWNPQTGECLKTLASEAIWSISWSPDGTLLASVGIDQQIHLWDWQTGQEIQVFSGHTGWLRSVAWHPDESLLASAGDDKTIRLWNLQGDCLATLEGHQNAIWSVVWSPDGRYLASASHDKTVRIWDWQTRQCLQTLSGHTNWVWDIDWSPNGQTLVSVSLDRTIKIWDVQSRSCLRTVSGHTSVAMLLSWSPDGESLAGSCDDQVVRLWHLKTGVCYKTLYGHENLVWSVDWHPRDNVLASSSDDHTVRLWDAVTGECLKVLEHDNWVWSVNWHPDGIRLASCTQDYVICIWDGGSGQCLKVLRGHQDSIWIVAWNADGTLLASGCDDQTVRIWDADTGDCLQVLQHGAAVRFVCWHPTQPWLVTGSADCFIRIWHIPTATCLKALAGHERSIWTVAWSPDGNTLASGGDDRSVRFWDAHTGESLHVLQGHTNQIWSVAWHPEGHILASSSADQTIRLWDSHTGQLLQQLQADRPYQGMNITGVTGLTEAQKQALQELGAVEVGSH